MKPRTTDPETSGGDEQLAKALEPLSGILHEHTEMQIRTHVEPLEARIAALEKQVQALLHQDTAKSGTE